MYGSAHLDLDAEVYLALVVGQRDIYRGLTPSQIIKIESIVKIHGADVIVSHVYRTLVLEALAAFLFENLPDQVKRFARQEWECDALFKNQTLFVMETTEGAFILRPIPGACTRSGRSVATHWFTVGHDCPASSIAWPLHVQVPFHFGSVVPAGGT